MNNKELIISIVLYFSEENLWGMIQLPIKVKDVKGLVSLVLRPPDWLQKYDILSYKSNTF